MLIAFTINIIQKTEDKEESILDLLLFLPFTLFFLLDVLRILLSFFFPISKTSFCHSLRVDLLKTNYLGVSIFKNILISLSCLKGIFTGYRILDWQFLFFSTWKILCHFLLAAMVSYEESSIIQIVFSLQVRYNFSPVFKIFFLLFSFLKFMMWAGVDFFGFIILFEIC